MKVVSLLGADAKRAVRRAEEMKALASLRSILRRRILCPVEGRWLMIEFETEVEAKECQRIMHDISKRRRPEYERPQS